MKLNSKQKPQRLLLVEDSVSFAYWLKTKLELEPGLEIVLARTLSEAKQAIKVFKGEFFLALLDLTLPDTTGDEVVKLAMEHKIPSVVFSGSYSDELRERLFNYGAIDYVIKDNPQSLNYVMSLVRRLRANQNCYALVVDDSATSRMQIAALLHKYRFQVVEASGGHEALAILEKNRDIRMVITDFNMPKMNGHELTKAIRQKYPPEKISIIGISGQDANPLSAKFLKFGANDFLNKPFIREEFFCRVTQNMDFLDHVQRLTDAATHDALTGLHKRRYFNDTVEALAAQARRDNADYAVGKCNLDNFQQINETHGHQVADQALQHAAKLIRDEFRRGSDIVARFDGDVFGVFMTSCGEDAARYMFERVRSSIEANPYVSNGKSIAMTVSIGFCSSTEMMVDEMLDTADLALRSAKDDGRNCIHGAGDGGSVGFEASGF